MRACMSPSAPSGRPWHVVLVALASAGIVAQAGGDAVADQRETMRIDAAFHRARMYSLRCAESSCNKAFTRAGRVDRGEHE